MIKKNLKKEELMIYYVCNQRKREKLLYKKKGKSTIYINKNILPVNKKNVTLKMQMC